MNNFPGPELQIVVPAEINSAVLSIWRGQPESAEIAQHLYKAGAI